MTNKPYMNGDFPYRTVEDVQRANSDYGGHYFDADTMRFFGSRVLDGVYFGRYFVTSERSSFDGSARAYSVREALPNGSVQTVGEFQGFATAESARRWIKRDLASGGSWYLEQACRDAFKWPTEPTWQRVADYVGAGLTRGTPRRQRERNNLMRAEVRRTFKRIAAELAQKGA